MYNLVCDNLQCQYKSDCHQDCTDCEHTTDCFQCTICDLYDTCTKIRDFRREMREYLRNLGRD